MTKRLWIETVGCQMNVLDSELVVAALRRQGWAMATSPAEADAVFYNTCSVRQHAEDKIYSALGRIRLEKQNRPALVVGVLGCMAQKDPELIRRRAPWVALVVGPGQLHQVPALVADVLAGSGPRLEVSLDRKGAARDVIARSFESYDPDRDPAMRPTPFQAFIRTQTGCDKFCAFCVVPHVRGPEQARSPETILAEARKLVAEGCREITLIGQTVNSYKYAAGGRTTRLADLLVLLDLIDGLDRIKFVTNYPRDMTDDLIAAVRDLPKVCHYLHVPAQHGSDAVLARMKRGYMIGDYMEMLGRVRAAIPHAAVTSDFIVGYCGETDAEFELSLDLVRTTSSSTAPGLGRRPTSGSPTTCRRRSRRSETGSCSRPRPKRASPATSGLSGPATRCSWRGSRPGRRSGSYTPAPTTPSNSQVARCVTGSSCSTPRGGSWAGLWTSTSSTPAPGRSRAR